MDAPQVACELADRTDIDQRYVTGTLPPDEAEAFEEHYFGCQRCWDLVQQGLALRAAGSGGPHLLDAGLGVPTGHEPVSARRRRWWAGLAAASVVLASAALWHSWRADAPADPDAVRGADATLVASASVRDDSIFATWQRVSTATDYRVRVSAPDGTALLERAVTDSTIAFPRSALRDAMADTLYLSVLARDALRRPVARSALTPLAVVRR